MYCKSCGVSLKVDAKFCGKCGTPVEATEPDGVRCPTCGTVNRAGAKFCRRDGTALQSPDQPRAEVRSATASVPEHTAAAALETVSTRPREKAAHVTPAAGPSSLPRPPQGGAGAAPGDAGRSRLWLALGAGVVLAVAGGGYWFYTYRSVPDTVSDNTGALGDSGVTTPQSRSPNALVSEPSEPTRSSDMPPKVATTSVEAPRVSVGDRWVTEVVDHQDSTLSYRAERTVTNVAPDRIWTEVRTLGKDYARVVEYTDEWALVATHLRSGPTTSYAPALPYLDFPLQTGKTWQATVTETDAEGRQRVHDVRARVEGWETVQVPAGSYRALKIVLMDDISRDGVRILQGQDVSWYAPEVRRTVKTEETSFDPAIGERRRRTISLMQYSLQTANSSVSDGVGEPAGTAADLSGDVAYEQACAACHGEGIAGAPRFGDKAAWTPRIAQGTETLRTHALRGYQGKTGYMPPKGGRAELSDRSVMNAVDYMVSAGR